MLGRSQTASSTPRFAAAGTALLTAGLLAANPAAVQLPAVQLADILLTAQDIVMDIVRHAEDAPPGNERVTFAPSFPGAGISANGEQEALDTAQKLLDEIGLGKVAGIFSGPDTDAQETAYPFADLMGISHDDIGILYGLTEVDGGIYSDLPNLSPAGILYALSSALWTLALPSVLPIPGALDYSGLIVLEKYNEAIDAVYNHAMDNPVIGDNGAINEAVFSSSAVTMIWVMNTVKNPDIEVLLKGLFDVSSTGVPQPLPNAGIVELSGNPEDGWTLVNWAGQPVSTDMGLLGDGFLLWRELVLPPQLAAYNLLEATLSGDPTSIGNAFVDGAENIGASLEQVPLLTYNVFEDIFTGQW